jgi:TonB-linked SusC/RagA family outer membrane protein
MEKNQCFIWKKYEKCFFRKILLIMKLTMFLILTTLGPLLAVQSYSQTTRLNLNLKNTTVEEVISKIEGMTDFYFLYNKKIIDVERKVTMNVEKKQITEVLDLLFADSGVSYTIVGRQIVLSGSNSVVQQQKTVKGKVTDSSGASLPGVTVMVKGTTNGTVTGADGSYMLTNLSPDAILVFSFVGMKAQEIDIAGKSSINVVLQEEAIGIEEVVAIGYGTQKKVNLTGAVAAIKGDELVNRAVTGTVDALQGVMPGVVITRSNGSPGQEDYRIQIRGVTSTTSTVLLTLIDGIEGDIQDVRPEDIESISVLKDAASAAIYGAKAAGGVILITTKSGKSGRISVEFNSYYTMAKLGRTPDRISSYQAGLLRNEAEINAGKSAPLSQEDLAKLADPNFLWEPDPANPNVYRYWGDYDYEKLVLKDFTPMQSHNVAISGGTEKTTFRLSGTYFSNDGSIKIGPDNNTKYSVRLNLNTQINNYLELSNVVAYSNDQIKKPRQDNLAGDYGLFAYVFTYPGLTPLRDPHGHHATGVRVNSFDGRIKFYQFDGEGGFMSWNKNNFRASSTLTIKNLVKNLQFRVVGGIDANFDEIFHHTKNIENYNIDETVSGNLISANMRRAQENSAFKEFQFLADYNFQIGKHDVSLFAGYSYQDYHFYSFEAYVPGLINENLPSFDWAVKTNMTLTDNAASSRYQSVFGRLKYTYDNRYLFETNLRYDGSSTLVPDDRYHLFPSLSAAWRVSEEDWFNISSISELKIRGSFGQLGNSSSRGYYDYIPLLTREEVLLLGSGQRAQYIYQSRLASKNLTWETIETSNIGLEISLFNNKLTFEGDYYVKRNKNMMAAVSYPSVLGIGVGNQNVGELKTWGWEANLGWKESRKEITYWINANIGDSENELVKYHGATVIAPGTRGLLEGYPVNSIFGYKTDGLFQTQQEVEDHVFQDSKTGPGDVKYVNLNDDEVISAGRQTEEDHGDLVYLGNNNPRYTFGIQGGFNWKGLDFSMFFQGVGRRVFMLKQQFIMPYSSGEFGPQKHNLDYWRDDNRDAFWPRLMVGGTHNFIPSDKWIQDAAYIRLKDIQIGYTIPDRLLSGIGIQKLRIYAAGHDIWESTKVLGFIDPETPNQATYQYPFRRSYTVGLNLNF